MNHKDTVWIFVTDARKARLLRGSLTRRDTPRLTEEGQLELVQPESERDRPSPRTGKDGHSYAARPGNGEEMAVRFAHQVVRFLQQNLPRIAPAQMHLFSPPKFLGVLRKNLPPALIPRLVQHEGELTNFSASELAGHPPIAALWTRARS